MLKCNLSCCKWVSSAEPHQLSKLSIPSIAYWPPEYSIGLIAELWTHLSTCIICADSTGCVSASGQLTRHRVKHWSSCARLKIWAVRFWQKHVLHRAEAHALKIFNMNVRSELLKSVLFLRRRSPWTMTSQRLVSPSVVTSLQEPTSPTSLKFEMENNDHFQGC